MFFKMRLKAKTYGIMFLITSRLRLNIFSYKQLGTENFIPYVLGFIFILKSIKKVFCFYIFIFKNMDMYEQIKNPK